MPTPARFLRAMGHALELRQRGNAEATLRHAADDACASAIYGLLLRDDRALFRFTPAGVSYGSLPLAEFQDWIWSRRLAESGIGRLELRDSVDYAGFAVFLVALRRIHRPTSNSTWACVV